MFFAKPEIVELYLPLRMDRDEEEMEAASSTLRRGAKCWAGGSTCTAAIP